MAALFLIFLLVASGGAVVGDDGASLPHLQLRGIPDSGPGHASEAPSQGLMDIMSMNGCGSFAGLLAATPNASEAFEQRIVAGGLTVFCPDDHAVAALEPKYTNLGADDQLAVLLLHGAAARYGRSQIAAFDSVAVSTLAADAATNKSLVVAVGNDGDAVCLWPSSGSGGVARVTKEIWSDDVPFAVYVIDAVLLPSHLRHGGYLAWLQYTIPVWVGICLAASSMVGVLAGVFVTLNFGVRMKIITVHRTDCSALE
ncbi:unnamed protein product [Alopecurus aequalis]